MLLFNGTDARRRVVGTTAESKMSLIILGLFLRDVRVGSVKRLSIRRFVKECNRQGVLMCVSRAAMKEWFD